jgi:hypothetical protein
MVMKEKTSGDFQYRYLAGYPASKIQHLARYRMSKKIIYPAEKMNPNLKITHLAIT